ncbi:MAG: hypothetical protein H0W44_05620 [Gammaproteobacteria bacterium]|nr:hypothetical protein [Gammaproteobacteria bacterium]
MGIKYRLEYPILHWIVEGDVDYQAGAEIVQQSFIDAQRTGLLGWHILADLNESKENKSEQELRDIAYLVSTHKGLLSGKLAIVVKTSLVFGTSRMFGVFMEDFGVEVNIFRCSVLEAERWLSGAENKSA